MSLDLTKKPILVIGAGIMGAGIAQVAAQSGNLVYLFDSRKNAAEEAIIKLENNLQKLVQKSKISAKLLEKILTNIVPIQSLSEVPLVNLVVEAVVENLSVKRSLFQELEALVSPECILASNTSSISVTAIANGLKHPSRMVGMHFFNPVPLMKLVEVISGLETDPSVAEQIFNLSKSWGKVPVYAKSTPGFIVNRIARPFYAESLALIQEQVAPPLVIDACIKSAGFRMGPCELMDLIGHDTNFSVTSSVYEANFFDKRYAPSTIQRDLVDGGLLGKKTGRGFYSYTSENNPPDESLSTKTFRTSTKDLVIHGDGPLVNFFIKNLDKSGASYIRNENSEWIGIEVNGRPIRQTKGETASELGKEVVVFDICPNITEKMTVAWAHSFHSTEKWIKEASSWLEILGFTPVQIQDSPGLIVARTIAMLINEAADAIQQNVCTSQDADQAMRLGVNYPQGPFDWLASWGVKPIVNVLDSLNNFYRGERYRVSPWLRIRSYN